MRAMWIATLMLVMLGLGFILGYYASTKIEFSHIPLVKEEERLRSTTTRASSLNLTLKVKQAPTLVTLRLPDGTRSVVWVSNLQASINGSGLSNPVIIKDVRVYVKIIVANETFWREIPPNSTGALDYSCTGDEILVPGDTARINIYLELPEEYKPLEVLVAVNFEGIGTIYSEPVKLLD